MESDMNVQNNVFRKIAITVVLVIASIIVLFPIYYMIIASFKDTSVLFKDGFAMLFRFDDLKLDNYVHTLTSGDYKYLHWYWNSLVIMIVSTVISIFLSSVSGYALGAYDFKGKNLIFSLVLIVMMFPLEIMLLPLYKMTIQMGIINTKLGSILPFLVVPTAMFFFKQYVSGINREFMDAGRVDGCSEWGIFVKIISPQMAPAFGAMTILLALRNWNAVLWPLIVFNSEKTFTLPVGLSSLLSTYGDNYEMLIPGAVLALIPLVLIFLFNQKQFITGLSSGGIKG